MKKLIQEKYLRLSITCASLVMLILGLYYYAAVAPSLVPTNHIDGTFQTASAMFRLKAGQIPGKDFFPYLGVGPLIFIFPFFKLFGGTVVASATAARFIILLTAMISSGVFIATLWNVRVTRALLAGGSSFMAIIMGLATLKIPVDSWFYFAVEPGASLRPLRAALPYFVLVIYFAIRSAAWAGKRASLRPTLYGVLAGWAALWSNDYAYITVIAFLALVVIDSAKPEKPWLSLAVASGSTIATFLIIGSAVTGFHLLDLIKYNFVDVSGDQWWYFGPWTDQGRVWGIDGLPKVLAQDNIPGLLLVLGLLTLWLIKKWKPAMYLVWLGLVLFGGGLLASIGGHLDLFYFGAFHYWAYVSVILLGLKGFMVWTKRLRRNNHANRKQTAVRTLAWPVAGLMATGFVAYTAVDNFNYIHSIEVSDPTFAYSGQLGGYIDSEWQKYVAFANQNADKSVVEEYWGVWSAALNKQAPFRVDSVIHSLGAERQVSDSRFGNPDLIITSSADALWQSWSFSYNYWFYQHIISGWHVAYQGPLTLVWQKNSDQNSPLLPTVACRVNSDNSITYDSKASGLYQVSVDYQLTKPGRSLVMLKNNIPKTGDDGLWVSMNEKASTMTLPAYSPGTTATTLPTKIVGAGVQKFAITGCQAKQLPQYATQILATATPVTPADFYATSDPSYGANGVSNTSATFVVPASAGNWFKFLNGNHVLLPDGSSRVIKSHYVADGKLYVVMDGDPFTLPANTYPDSLNVTK